MAFPLDSGTALPEEQAGIAGLDLTGTTVLVTGSTSGIGRAAALALGRLGAEVFVHGRDTEAGETVVAEIETGPGSARFFRADFTDSAAVSGLAAAVENATDSLDVLCNNAGGVFTDLGPTDLGVDRAFHVNHLAPYQLTAELLGTLGPGSRVVTTASIAHRGATLSLDRLFDLAGLGPMAAYCRSKLANVQFALALADRLRAADREVSSTALHPGVIPGSEFGRFMSGVAPTIGELAGTIPVFDTVEDGATTIVYLAAAPAGADVTGAYFTRCRQVRPAAAARDRTAQRALWERSADLLGIDEPLADAAPTID
jgi:NAD(P)-dependent dehydrogenase (short-subunit alcohol dehydrogenase family)